MIRTEQVMIDGREFTYTYSDSGRYVVRNGVSYDEAYDPVEFGREYTEGDVIPQEEPTDEDYAEAGKILMGVQDESEE